VMPDKEGIETIKDLRHEFPKMGIIAMSGMAGSDTFLLAARQMGAKVVFQKPLELNMAS